MTKPIIIAICLILTLAFGLGLIWPQYKTLKATQLQIETKNTELQSKKAYFEDLAKISEELKKYPEELAKIDSALSTDISLPSIFNFFEKKASESGLVLKQVGSVSITPKKENSGLKEYRSTISLSGSYTALKNFLLNLEKSARIFETEKISFSSPTKKETTFSFDLVIKFYSY